MKIVQNYWIYTLSIRRSWVFINATQVGCLIPVEDANIRDSGAKATACGRLASLAAASGKGKVDFTDHHLYHQMSCPRSFEKLNKHHSAATRVIYLYIGSGSNRTSSFMLFHRKNILTLSTDLISI